MSEQTNKTKHFLVKLDSYSKKNRADIFISLYRRFQIKPIFFWHPVKVFLFVYVMGHFLLSSLFTGFGLFIHFSFERMALFLDFLMMPELMLSQVPMALSGMGVNIYLRKKLKLRWEDLEG